MARLMLGASILCLLATLVIVHGHEKPNSNFEIHGRVYCDPCRLRFETRLSYPIDGVTVQLECKNLDNQTITFETHTKTCEKGTYKIEVPGDHQEEECQVSLKKNPSHQCCDAMGGRLSKDQVSLTLEAGLDGKIRYANDLGFMTKTINHECLRVVKELALTPDFYVKN